MLTNLALTPMDTVRTMPRRAAHELVLAAVLAPAALSDVTAPVVGHITAMDASPSHGRLPPTPPELARALWRHGEKHMGATSSWSPGRAASAGPGALCH